MHSFIKISGYTIRDILRQKSFLVLLIISVLFILMIRSCYSGDFVVNGQKLDSVTVAFHASIVVFHVIAVGMFLMTALLSMKTFTRDNRDGSLTMFLSRPVFRWHYLFGRITGTWLVCLVFMFIMHTTIFLIVWGKTGGIIPGYLSASLIASINLLFIISCVCLLSFFLPDIISAFITLALVGIGFLSDGGHQILSSEFAQSAFSSELSVEPSLWRVLYPKVFMVQAFAGSLISKNDIAAMGFMHPLVNICLYILLLMGLLWFCFNKREVA